MHSHKISSILILAIVALAMAGGALAAPIADVTVHATVVEFVLPASSASNHTLTVGGPRGYHTSRDFGASETPFFAAVTEHGGPLAAGLYTWTLSENLAPAERGRTASSNRQSRSQTGRFTISADGSIVDPNQIEGGWGKAEVLFDDLIIDFNACVGNSCSNGESFGFDSLRMHENNTRIHFNDTSSSGSFASNDWRLIANDQANGGADYFAIEDATAGDTVFRVEAGAPESALYVGGDGFVGIGTSSPTQHLHLTGSNSPTLRIEQDSSEGYAPQAWDLGGNEQNFFVRDVNHNANLPFVLETGGPENSVYIDGTGVGLGTSSPDAHVDVEADGPAVRLTNSGSGSGIWEFFVNSGTNRMNLTDDATLARVPFKFAPGADHNLVRVGVGAPEKVRIGGNLVVTGSISPDYVFEPGFELESIEAHAAFMWREKHLPGVPAARTNAEGKGVVNHAARSQGMLEELEKAHIYIEQLYDRIESKEQQLTRLAGMLDRLSALEQKLLVD